MPAARASSARRIEGTGRDAASRHTASMCSPACRVTNSTMAAAVPGAWRNVAATSAMPGSSRNSAPARRIRASTRSGSAGIRSQCGQCLPPRLRHVRAR
ncbi:hypothetical protein G6F66_014900 [Rhizopus arrhizus]|nr:hypothetical protein G6F66_014900 [Rhizopus arrhizus]